MDRPSLPITFKNLIESGSLSGCTFSFGGGNGAANNPSSPSRCNSIHLNAVNISLVLVRAFAGCVWENISAVQLEHVTVHVPLSQLEQNEGLLEQLTLGQSNARVGRPHAIDLDEWTLKINTNPATSQRSSDGDVGKMLRHLGQLVYSVFSQNKMLPNQTSDDGSRSNTPDITRSNKRVGDRPSLFSYLVETGEYPIAVCRLISDMADTGVGGKADSPFDSLDEVVQDLEQMTSYPDIFLYDADGFNNLVFGQRYYGQKEEISQLLSISTSLEQRSSSQSTDTPPQAEVVFITGVAGQGKTHLVSRTGDFLSSLGNWIVAETKFVRDAQHESTQRISSLFDGLVRKIVAMSTSSKEADVEYCRRAKEAISGAIDSDSMAMLAGFIPSIGSIFPGTTRKDPELLKSWQLTFLLTKLLDAVISLDRSLMLVLDDLQWCDRATLALMAELIVRSGQESLQRLLFVGTYRSNEVSGLHPLTIHYNDLKASKHVRVTNIPLSSLENNAVLEMVSTEMRLPKRYVVRLAETVHRKTSGHALFVVQLLNSLVRDGVVAYSPKKLRYDSDTNELASLQTHESVASLIVANFASLPDVDLRSLRVLSCLGMQSHESILDLIEECPGVSAISPSLDRLIDDGTLEKNGELVRFSHDLIHQSIKQIMTEDERKHLQYAIGVYLGSKTSLDTDTAEYDNSVEAGMGQLRLRENDGQDDTPLASLSSLIAVDMVNNAGPEYIEAESARTRFARWNLWAASEAKAKSKFRSALHYYTNGIAFLDETAWSSNLARLCLKLYEGAAFTSNAIGSTTDAARYANAISDHVAFEDRLFAEMILLRALESAGKMEQIIARGVALLRTLNFNIPSDPTPEIVLQTLIQTENMAYQYSLDDVLWLQQNAEAKALQRNTLNIVEAVAAACYQTSSPYYPLVTCALMDYSLVNGIICDESAMAFAAFAVFLIDLQAKFDAAKKFAVIAESILQNSTKPNVRAAYALNGHANIWFRNLLDLSDNLFHLYEIGLKAGDLDGAMFCLQQCWRFRFYGCGHNLSVLSLSYAKFMSTMVKYSRDIAMFSILDISLTLELMGSSGDPYSLHFDGTLADETELALEAKRRNKNLLLQLIALKQFFSAFFLGKYAEASILSKEALSFPTAKTAKLQLIFHYFYHGLTSFHLYREGKGESHLEEGKKMVVQMKEWHPNSPHTFDNKLFLLEAEYLASMCNRNAAMERYEASIKAARDNGLIHERGLAYEFMGHYLASIIETNDSKECYMQAYECYMQWGAAAKAKQIQKDHGLDGEVVQSSLKHGRER